MWYSNPKLYLLANINKSSDVFGFVSTKKTLKSEIYFPRLHKIIKFLLMSQLLLKLNISILLCRKLKTLWCLFGFLKIFWHNSLTSYVLEYLTGVKGPLPV